MDELEVEAEQDNYVYDVALDSTEWRAVLEHLEDVFSQDPAKEYLYI